MRIDKFRLHLLDSEPEMIKGLSYCVAVCSILLVGALPAWAAHPAPTLALDKPATVRFLGSQAAELFTREVTESYQGALQFNFVAEPGGKYPPGFLHASPVPQGWSGTFWTRDGG
ncbi:MAG TPA: hypothetical protein VN673_14670, partial [Clostridia bacterium]|nr:hypothetical protein [Clostridia bacterium]